MAAGLQRKLAAVSTGDQVALLWFSHLNEVSVGRKTSDKWKKQKSFFLHRILHRTSCQESRESSLYLGACVPEHLNPQ